MITAPVFVFLSLFLRGGSKPGLAVFVAALTTGGIWLVFSWLMKYEIYMGLFFEELY